MPLTHSFIDPLRMYTGGDIQDYGTNIINDSQFNYTPQGGVTFNGGERMKRVVVGCLILALYTPLFAGRIDFRVARAVVVLNGTIVIGDKELPEHRKVLSLHVPLQQSNTICVTLGGGETGRVGIVIFPRVVSEQKTRVEASRNPRPFTVLHDRFASLGVPAMAGLPFGR